LPFEISNIRIKGANGVIGSMQGKPSDNEAAEFHETKVHFSTAGAACGNVVLQPDIG
jgi:hypothetical protein